MHERKALMADLSDGFIALPAARGRWRNLRDLDLGTARPPPQAGWHPHNVDGFYDALIRFIEHQATEEFMRQEHRDMTPGGHGPGAAARPVHGL
jgi:predicted Rossmann-fold nucleotide-binding protein